MTLMGHTVDYFPSWMFDEQSCQIPESAYQRSKESSPKSGSIDVIKLRRWYVQMVKQHLKIGTEVLQGFVITKLLYSFSC